MRALVFITMIMLLLIAAAQARPGALCDAPINQIACQLDQDGFVSNVWFGAWGNNKAASCPPAAAAGKAARPTWGKARPSLAVCKDAETSAPSAAEFLAIPNTRTTMGVVTEMRWVASKDYSALRRVSFVVDQYDRLQEKLTGETLTLTCGDKFSKLDRNPTDGWKAPKGLVLGSLQFKCQGAAVVYPEKACFTSPSWYPSKEVLAKTC